MKKHRPERGGRGGGGGICNTIPSRISTNAIKLSHKMKRKATATLVAKANTTSILKPDKDTIQTSIEVNIPDEHECKNSQIVEN